jgi:predicted DCC family thiol-disulfide oxidoreductase YuxK
MTSPHDYRFDNILLFDGVCNLCNGTVQFLLRIDRKQKLRFAALQSASGQQILDSYHYTGPPLQTVVFCSRGKLFTHSSGMLEVCRVIGFPWSSIYLFKLIPAPVRDAVYRWIARNRYRWFGKKETCWIPTPELRQRFLS